MRGNALAVRTVSKQATDATGQNGRARREQTHQASKLLNAGHAANIGVAPGQCHAAGRRPERVQATPCATMF